MFKLVFYVPSTHVDQVKEAVFDAGAGHIGHYDRCAWQVLGQGQFRPLAKSNPFVGRLNELETVNEYRVELVCAEECIKPALRALKQAHPYETPAYDVWQLADFE